MKHVYFQKAMAGALLLLGSHLGFGQQGGVLDGTTFGTGTLGGSNFLSATTIDANQKILIGGSFTSFNGTSINNFARLNADGTIDGGFITGTGPNGFVRAVVVQPSDNKILIGGTFPQYNGVNRTRIARINTDGGLDGTFTLTGTGVTGGDIFGIGLQSDGKIIIVGTFTGYNGTTTNRIARLNTDGSLDATFTTNLGGAADGTVNRVAIQSDDKIVVVGAFTTIDGVSSPRVARLNSDGTPDATFITNIGLGANGTAEALTIQSNGSILVGGAFTSFNSVSTGRIVRLAANGTPDASFTTATGTGVGNNTVFTIRQLSNGNIMLAGSFTTFNGVGRSGIARLLPTGALDANFIPGTGTTAQINIMNVQSDGKIVLGGAFPTYNGVTRNRIARIHGDLTAATTAQTATITSISANNVYALGSTDGSIVAKVVPNGATPVSGNVTAQVFFDGSVQSVGSIPYLQRHYEITPAAGTTARVTLYFTQAEFDAFNAVPNGNDLPYNGADVENNKANIRFTKYAGSSSPNDGNPANYSGGSTIIDPADPDIIWNSTTSKWEISFDVTGFSGFFMQTSLNVLPVKLKNFTARAEGVAAKLDWNTASEQNSSHFNVERSLDGNNFAVAGKVNAAGNSSSSRSYNFTDNLAKVPHTGVVYYRLHMIDRDGKAAYSDIKSIRPGKVNLGAALLQNPVSSEARVLYQAAASEKINIRVLDSRGQLVMQTAQQVSAGANQLKLATANLAKGIYSIEVTGNGNRQTLRLVKE